MNLKPLLAIGGSVVVLGLGGSALAQAQPYVSNPDHLARAEQNARISVAARDCWQNVQLIGVTSDGKSTYSEGVNDTVTCSVVRKFADSARTQEIDRLNLAADFDSKSSFELKVSGGGDNRKLIYNEYWSDQTNVASIEQGKPPYIPAHKDDQVFSDNLYHYAVQFNFLPSAQAPRGKTMISPRDLGRQ